MKKERGEGNFVIADQVFLIGNMDLMPPPSFYFLGKKNWPDILS
jgi:hypothetical protein